VKDDEPPTGWSVTERRHSDGCEVITAPAHPYGLERIVGASAAMTALRHLVARVAIRPASTILLSGEHGTGKALIANVIHETGDRSSKPFMHITRVMSPEQLLDSGPLAMANGGTVFLDDIGVMVPALQASVLRALADGRFDVRVIAATSRDVGPDVGPPGVLSIAVPPLRSHLEDISLLVEHFVETFNAQFGTRVIGATSAVYTLLQSYDWPGNVRELRNVIECAMLLRNRDRLEARDFPLMTRAGNEFELPANGVDLEDVERTLLIQALRRCNGNQTRAGNLLGLNRDQIRYRIEKFGLATAPLTH
jgi:DNA-binding NtrC family response regulator